MLTAETILMSTGLLTTPDPTHVRADDQLLKDARDEMIAALDREEPGRLYVCPQRPGYFDRLTIPPDYERLAVVVELMLGTETADAYTVLHQQARQTLLDLRPKSSIETVMGDLVLPLDPISDGRWLLEVDTVEGMRLTHDLAAGALLKEEVDVFSAAFPEAYGFLLDELNKALAKRAAAKQGWEPAPWLADSLRVFEGRPFGAKLEITPPKSPPPSPPKTSKSGKLDTEILKTKSQTT